MSNDELFRSVILGPSLWSEASVRGGGVNSVPKAIVKAPAKSTIFFLLENDMVFLLPLMAGLLIRQIKSPACFGSLVATPGERRFVVDRDVIIVIY
jgi:hypothetical protein